MNRVFYLLSILLSTSLVLAGPFKQRENFYNHNYKESDLLIMVFGASVTAQKNNIWSSFIEFFNKKLKRKHFFIISGHGGEHLYPQSLCHIDTACSLKPDICIVDWFDTGFLETNDITKKSIETLIRKLRQIGCYIIFYYHFRLNDNPEKRVSFIKYVDSIAYMYGVSSYNEYEAVDCHNINGESLLRDVVHTTPEGSKILGEIFCDYFLKIQKNGFNYFHSLYPLLFFPPKNEFYNIKKQTITLDMIHGKTKKDIDGYWCLNKKNVLELALDKNLFAIEMKIGSYSPIIECSERESGINHLFQLWDPYCHYERKQILPFENITQGEWFFSITNNPIDYSKCRRKVDFTGVEKMLKVKDFFCYEGYEN